MKKIILFFVLVVLFCTQVSAKGVKTNLQSIINQSGIDKNSVSVSVKSLDNGKVIYSLNDRILMHPASVQKILTLPSAMEKLGEDYEFTTGIYSRGDDGYLIKLGADPYLTSSDLKRLIKNVDSKKVKQIFIDDTITENKSWGEGWQWDDDLNLSMTRFNSYNLDKNIIKFTIMPTTPNEKTFIINPSKYPIVFLNNVVTGDKNQVKVSRDSSAYSNSISLEGTVSSPYIIKIPINNLKRYFDFKLTQVMADQNIYLKTNFISSKISEKDILIDEVRRPVSVAETDILSNSNNAASEILSKLAGGKAYGLSGDDKKGLKLFDEYCKKLNLDNSRIRLVDASGVSKNNLVDTDFVTEFLVKSKDNVTLLKMTSPGNGTLANRMIPIGENLKAKTGTLSDISSLAGYLTTKNGKKYVFCIIINDPKSSSSDKKSLEDYLIREMYLNL